MDAYDVFVMRFESNVNRRYLPIPGLHAFSVSIKKQPNGSRKASPRCKTTRHARRSSAVRGGVARNRCGSNFGPAGRFKTRLDAAGSARQYHRPHPMSPSGSTNHCAKKTGRCDSGNTSRSQQRCGSGGYARRKGAKPFKPTIYRNARESDSATIFPYGRTEYAGFTDRSERATTNR